MSEHPAEIDALRTLVSDWQANGNSRPLGDPTAATWHECAIQLLRVIDGSETPAAPSARRHAGCGSIQCVECRPGWGEQYNEAVQTHESPAQPSEED